MLAEKMVQVVSNFGGLESPSDEDALEFLGALKPGFKDAEHDEEAEVKEKADLAARAGQLLVERGKSSAAASFLAHPAPVALKVSLLEGMGRAKPPPSGSLIAERLSLAPGVPFSLGVVGLLRRCGDAAALFTLRRVFARRPKGAVADEAKEAVKDILARKPQLAAPGQPSEDGAPPLSAAELLLAVIAADASQIVRWLEANPG